jgi:hypothetical protein
MNKEAPDHLYMVFSHFNSEVEYIRADLHQAEVDALHAEFDRLTALVGHDNQCSWYIEDGSDTYTGCGVVFYYEVPSENGFKFCPYCGGEIRMGEEK